MHFRRRIQFKLLKLGCYNYLKFNAIFQGGVKMKCKSQHWASVDLYL